MENLSSGEKPNEVEKHKFAGMSSLIEILVGVASLSDAYACPRRYEAEEGPQG